MNHTHTLEQRTNRNFWGKTVRVYWLWLTFACPYSAGQAGNLYVYLVQKPKLERQSKLFHTSARIYRFWIDSAFVGSPQQQKN